MKSVHPQNQVLCFHLNEPSGRFHRDPMFRHGESLDHGPSVFAVTIQRCAEVTAEFWGLLYVEIP